MADWTNIADSQVDPDAPITSELGYAFRDNPIAITEGAAGAPRILDAALSSTVTGAGSTWVGERYGNQGVQGVGMVIMGMYTGINAPIASGTNVSGADIFPCSATGTAGAGPRSGTWRCQGHANAPSTASGVTTWVRVS